MRRATIRNRVDDANTVLAALAPDNTSEMRSRVEDGELVTTIERETTGGLRSTVDDFVVNLTVAVAVGRRGKGFSGEESNDEPPDGRGANGPRDGRGANGPRDGRDVNEPRDGRGVNEPRDEHSTKPRDEHETNRS